MARVAARDLQLWQQLTIVQRWVARDLDRILREALGYPALWIDTLAALTGTPKGRERMTRLGDQLGIDHSVLSRIVDLMVAAGLIRREPHPTDGRVVMAVLTPRGRRELRRALPASRDAIRQTGLGSLTKSEKRALQRVLRKVGRGGGGTTRRP